jgi:hypothetical protein
MQSGSPHRAHEQRWHSRDPLAMKTPRTLGFWLVAAVAVVLGSSGVAGCGVLNTQRALFPFRAVGNEGQGIVLDDVEDIVNNPRLTEDEKRQALRDELGIRDEQLIDALLQL